MKNKKFKKTQDELAQAALTVATVVGYDMVSREDCARLLGCSPSLVPYYFGSMDEFHYKIMQAAIKFKCRPVIAQGIVRLHPLCQALTKEERREILSLYVDTL